jgi:hypothetical protein
MDADDVALPERLARQRAFLLARPEVGLVGTQVAPLGAVRAGRSLRLPLTHDEIYAALAAGRHALAHTSVMGRTDLIKRVGGYWPLPLGEDYDLLLRLGEVARLANLDEVLHHYRVHPGSLNGSFMRRLRLSVDYACELARRRRTGEPRLTLAEFQARRDARPWWRKWGESINLHARCQYRIALAEMYGGRRWRGSLRMAGAAVCSPRLSVERIARILGRFRAERPSSSSIDQSAMGAESTCQ